MEQTATCEKFMEIPPKYKGRYFYHFTHFNNIESIVKHGLLSLNEKKRLGIQHVDLANENIQQRRSQMIVPCEPYGTIHDYVPFYFASTNPMLLSVLNRKNIDQPLVVFIAISVERIIHESVIFTNASANTSVAPDFFNSPEDLDNLKWDLIDRTTWSRGTDEELHFRMAEVLILNKVPIDWLDCYIVFNSFCKDGIELIYAENKLQQPKIEYQPFNNRYFFFSKFYMRGRENETLIMGPILLKNRYDNLLDTINEKRKDQSEKTFTFSDIDDAIRKISENFCVLPELEGIFELETDNKVHNESVSDHTLHVVRNLEQNQYYRALLDDDKKLVKLSAYLHDIGKGPKSKWKNNIQVNYPDHPADSIPMLERIMINEFKVISEYEIRMICLLVVYHDIIGDIINKGRSLKELVNLKVSRKTLDLLIALTLADVAAISRIWFFNIEINLQSFIDNITKEIEI
jgi:hypothetical protein